MPYIRAKCKQKLRQDCRRPHLHRIISTRCLQVLPEPLLHYDALKAARKHKLCFLFAPRQSQGSTGVIKAMASLQGQLCKRLYSSGICQGLCWLYCPAETVEAASEIEERCPEIPDAAIETLACPTALRSGEATGNGLFNDYATGDQ